MNNLSYNKLLPSFNIFFSVINSVCNMFFQIRVSLRNILNWLLSLNEWINQWIHPSSFSGSWSFPYKVKKNTFLEHHLTTEKVFGWKHSFISKHIFWTLQNPETTQQQLKRWTDSTEQKRMPEIFNIFLVVRAHTHTHTHLYTSQILTTKQFLTTRASNLGVGEGGSSLLAQIIKFISLL